MTEDLRQQQVSRINLYALISRLIMSEVDEDLLRSIEEDENMLSFFPEFSKWERRSTMERKDLIEQYINADYTNLFLLHLIPYESFYTREDQMMETGGDNPIQAIYDAYNFSVELDKARIMAGDHIGVELEFMYKLCESEMNALEDGEYEMASEISLIQQGFLRDHVLQWIPMFLLNVKSEAATAFYFDVADLALEFVMSDFEYLTRLQEDGFKYEG